MGIQYYLYIQVIYIVEGPLRTSVSGTFFNESSEGVGRR